MTYQTLEYAATLVYGPLVIPIWTVSYTKCVIIVIIPTIRIIRCSARAYFLVDVISYPIRGGGCETTA